MRVIFVRHGQATCNELPDDFEMHLYDDEAVLNCKGINQMERLATFTKNLYTTYTMYTSPLVRAIQSPTILHKNHPARKLISIESLRELRAKRPFDRKITVQQWDAFLELRYLDHLSTPFGLESLQSQYIRISEFCANLRDNHECDTVVIVTHAFCIEMAMAYYMGIPLESLKSLRLRVSNSGVFIVDVLGGINKIVSMNSLAHLSKY
jgi:broad specificity phosphatase PhoE